MNQFHWKGSQPSNNKGAVSVNTTNASGSGDLSGVKIQPNQSYSAKIVTVANVGANQTTNQTNRQTANQTTKQPTGQPAKPASVQIQISVPQPNGQNVTLTQPLPQLPQGFNANQQIQVLLNIGKNGELTISLSANNQNTPSNTTANTTANAINNSIGSNTQPQTIKLSLSNSQLVDLLSLNKAYKSINNGQMQTTAKIVQQHNQAPQLQLPGNTANIKLPQNIASLLQGQKTVSVTLKPQGQDIALQIELPKTAKTANGSLTTTITAEKLSPIIKQALNQTPNQQITLSKPASGDKITLANQQTLNLGSKIPTLQAGTAELKVSQLSSGQLTIQISNKNQTQTASVKIDIPSTQLSNSIKQALSPENTLLTENKGNLVKNLSNNQSIENGKIVSHSNHQSTTKTAQPDTTETQASPNTLINAKSAADLQIQKQALQQFIDPIVRLLLPKKLDWSEGFKTLAALEQSLKPDTKAQQTQSKLAQTAPEQTPNRAAQPTVNVQNADTQNSIDLKQLINQVKQAIPDHTANLDDKTITSMVNEILNFSPTKTATPSTQPTPANAIANALQLLLGAKLSQGEAKLSTQLQQQLQQLIKPMAPKAPATEVGVKNAMQGLNNLDQASGSLKALTGIQSTIRHQQVENIEKRLDGNNQLEFSFPLRVDGQVKELHIAINEEKHKSETSSTRLSIWNLNLTFDLNDFGKLLVNAKLKDGEVSMHMYAEQPKTLSLMNKFSATLEQRLEFHGVKINNIQSSLGKISSTNSKRQLNSLVQIKV